MYLRFIKFLYQNFLCFLLSRRQKCFMAWKCKAGEATSSRFWKPYLEYKSDLFPTLKGIVMFWSLSIRTSCKMFFPHKVWFNINIRQKASCTKAPLLIKKKWFKSPVITTKMLRTSLTFDLVFFSILFDLVTYEMKQINFSNNTFTEPSIHNFECLNPFFIQLV